MKHIYIKKDATEHWGVVLQNNQLEQVVVERPHTTSQVGNLYIGRVVNISISLQAAFVDFGQGKPGFLKRNELPAAREDDSLPIQRLVHEGQAVLVQVTKDAYDQKGAQLTANITLPGIDLVYLPFGNYYAISRKLAVDARTRLKQWAHSVCVDKEGVIVRTGATNKTEEQLVDELNTLRERWRSLQETIKQKRPPYLVLEDKELPYRFLRKFPDQVIDHVYIDNQQWKKSIEAHFPYLQGKCTWVREIEKELPFTFNQITERVMNRSVPLESGAQLTFDETEAMVVVDVNSATFTRSHSKQQTALKTNIEAAKEIARQIQLRNVSGMIVIDFISMKRREDQQKVLQTLKQAVRHDPIRTEVHDFTALGLVELTRKREAPSLFQTFGQSCGTCAGGGAIISPETYAYQLERELLSYKWHDQDVIVMEVRSDIIQAFREVIDINVLKSSLYKQLYVIENRERDVTYKLRFIGDVDTLSERPFFKKGILDRVF
ncbi:Rne/Rng family ribonuclease [Pontibacillus litoralis]|uniref:S1 motif domain-containing protein n=1 Tax=Pontibacillus litoralis JSM 072002 TaxID=1385512 RepID=A0A0A5G7T3_9BACI|nr:Rne/Rng family ribonuclease [Pontibacillus litoralis]KGX89201.1 hypothetical protein N784_01360 [Pontibacillus litoralis JSM 072002]